MFNRVLLGTVIIAVAICQTAANKWNVQPGCPKYSGLIFLDTAKNSKGLSHTVQKFRDLLGGVDNGNDAGQNNGQRSINWDADIVPFDMPGDFFKNTVTRGAEFFASKGKFAVSNPPPNAWVFVDNRFSSFNKNFPHIFTTFSPKRLFTPVKSNVVTTIFSVPKKHEKAHVSGFGAVFTNVVLKHTTLMEFYDKNNCLIIRLQIPPQPKGLSFGGIIVQKINGKKIKAAIASVKVTLGNGIISQSHENKNFVVLDDLIFGEPLAINS